MAGRRSYRFTSTDEDEATIRVRKRDAKRKAIDLVAYLDMYDPALYPAAVLQMNKDAWMETAQQAYIDLKRAFMFVEEIINEADRQSFDVLTKKMKDKMNAFLVNFYNKVLNVADVLPAISPSLTPADLVSLCVAAAQPQAVSVQAAPVPVTAAQAVNVPAAPVHCDQAVPVYEDVSGSGNTATVTSPAPVDIREDTEMPPEAVDIIADSTVED